MTILLGHLGFFGVKGICAHYVRNAGQIEASSTSNWSLLSVTLQMNHKDNAQFHKQ